MPAPTPSRPTYVLPIKVRHRADLGDLTPYLRWLASRADVVVVDGSPADVAAQHARSWGGFVRHRGVQSRTLNGKVAGVLDGVVAASTPYVVIADDDVRYDDEALSAVVARLDNCAAVVPQNYFSPRPWHARWDTARSLVNRAFGGDYAGTVAVRREALSSTGGYCGAVLFENLELVRTLTAHGHVVCAAPDVFVARRPPTARHFAGQRIRQAYDSRAQPSRLAAELLLLPALLVCALLRRSLAAALLASTVAVAEVGRRRAGGRVVFGAGAAMWAPAWVLERSVTSWLAVVSAARGGVRYGGGRLRTAAHSTHVLATPRCPERACVCATPWRPTADAIRDRPLREATRAG